MGSPLDDPAFPLQGSWTLRDSRRSSVPRAKHDGILVHFQGETLAAPNIYFIREHLDGRENRAAENSVI